MLKAILALNSETVEAVRKNWIEGEEAIKEIRREKVNKEHKKTRDTKAGRPEWDESRINKENKDGECVCVCVCVCVCGTNERRPAQTEGLGACVPRSCKTFTDGSRVGPFMSLLDNLTF